jgi:hypothetical protein
MVESSVPFGIGPAAGAFEISRCHHQSCKSALLKSLVDVSGYTSADWDFGLVQPSRQRTPLPAFALDVGCELTDEVLVGRPMRKEDVTVSFRLLHG